MEGVIFMLCWLAAFVIYGTLRLLVWRNPFNGQLGREIQFYGRAIGRNYFVDEDFGIAGDLDLWGERYLREVVALEAAQQVQVRA